MQIKTVWIQAQYLNDFDRAVNASLSDGWILKRREIIRPQTQDKNSMLYAELEKPDEKDLQEAELKKPEKTDPQEYRMILLEPDVSFLVNLWRGQRTRNDYVNTALLLGMEAMKKWDGNLEATINKLFDYADQHEEESDDEQ